MKQIHSKKLIFCFVNIFIENLIQNWNKTREIAVSNRIHESSSPMETEWVLQYFFNATYQIQNQNLMLFFWIGQSSIPYYFLAFLII